VKYDPAADPGPIDAILRQYVSPENVEFLYQIPAQAILQGFCECTSFKTNYMIQGAANGGKSTYVDLLVDRFFSPRFVASENLQDLCGGNRFSTSSLPGKFLNCFDDLDNLGGFENVGSFKALTGSYNQSVEKKGVNRRTAKIFCPHLFTCNRPPLLDSAWIKTDRAWWLRWVYIGFNDSGFEVDPTFQDRNFTPENLSGFLNTVLGVVIGIIIDPSQFKRMEPSDVLANWDTSSDPLVAFMSECFYPLPTGKTTKFGKEAFLKSYREYCATKSTEDIHSIGTIEKLSRHLFDLGFTDARGKGGKGGKRDYLYQASLAWQGVPSKPNAVTNPTHKEELSQKEVIS
jgi:phage/plasmid-associated DNA primase